jgi:hypothetical protein
MCLRFDRFGGGETDILLDILHRLGSLHLIHKCIVTSVQGSTNIQYGLFTHLRIRL